MISNRDQAIEISEQLEQQENKQMDFECYDYDDEYEYGNWDIWCWPDF